MNRMPGKTRRASRLGAHMLEEPSLQVAWVDRMGGARCAFSFHIRRVSPANPCVCSETTFCSQFCLNCCAFVTDRSFRIGASDQFQIEFLEGHCPCFSTPLPVGSLTTSPLTSVPRTRSSMVAVEVLSVQNRVLLRSRRIISAPVARRCAQSDTKQKKCSAARRVKFVRFAPSKTASSPISKSPKRCSDILFSAHTTAASWSARAL